MLRIRSLSPAQQRELQHWQSSDNPLLARRAQFVLWSARGWSVPALAHVLGRCRRTVRRWLHGYMPTWTPASSGCWVAWQNRGRAGRAGKGR